jgi:hypothetical protein
MRPKRKQTRSLQPVGQPVPQEARFGERVVAKKKALVFRTIRDHLDHFPASRVRDEDLGLHIYHVTNTPFVLAYDFDELELRIHYVLYESADRTRIDPATITI